MATEHKSPQRKKHLETSADNFTAGLDLLGQRGTEAGRRLTRLQRVLVLGLALFVARCAAQSPPIAQQQFEDVAAKLRAFPPDRKFYAEGVPAKSGERIFGSSERVFGPSMGLDMEHRSGWPVTPGLADYQALISADYPVPFLLSLLKDPNPRIRTLAAAALVAKGDVRLQQNLAPLVRDQSATFDAIVAPLTDMYRPPHYAPQTVGTAILLLVGMSSADAFDQYWAIHGGRDHCAGWFLWQFLHPAFASVAREEIQRLPSPDRELTILWIGKGDIHLSSRNYAGYSEDELLDAAKKLGRDNILATLRGEAPTTDPDILQLQGHNDVLYDRQAAIGHFLLAHAKVLLNASDADTLLGLETAERNIKNPQHPAYREWWPIAAANLRPKDADTILGAAEIRWPHYGDIQLARWDTHGRAALPKILEEFYTSPNAEEALAVAIHDADPNNSYQSLVDAILASDGHLHISGKAMYHFGQLARNWKVSFDREIVDWVYAQPPDADLGSWTTPRDLVVRSSRVARKLILDPRFSHADGQLLYVIEQSNLELALNHAQDVRLNQLIMQLHSQHPKSDPEPILEETRALLREGVRVQ